MTRSGADVRAARGIVPGSQFVPRNGAGRIGARLVWTALVCAVSFATACAPRPDSKAAQGQSVARSEAATPAQPQAGAQSGAPLSATDPCAERLHALSGPLLYYYALNRRLPERIEELESLAGPDPAVGLDCPVSHQRYVYVPEGFAMRKQPGFVVLHDAAPSHGGFRWAVVVEEPKGPKQPLITRVVAVPEAMFLQRQMEAAEPSEPDGDAQPPAPPQPE